MRCCWYSFRRSQRTGARTIPGDAEEREPAEPHAAEREHGHREHAEQRRGAEVRLQQHGDRRDGHHQAAAPPCRAATRPTARERAKMCARITARRELHELRRLDRDRAEADPPPRAAADAPDERHREDISQHDAVDDPRAAVDAAVVEGHGEQHADAARREPCELPHTRAAAGPSSPGSREAL